MDICPSSWAVGISKKIWIQTYSEPVTAILLRFSTILHFGATEPDLPAFILYLRTAFFEAHLLS